MLRWLLGILISAFLSRLLSRWGLVAMGLFAGYHTISGGEATRQIVDTLMPPPQSAAFIASVTYVVDGDTLDVQPATNNRFGRSYRLRLDGIDTPEKYGPTACPAMAAIARDVLSDQLIASGNFVKVRIIKRIGARWLAQVATLDDQSIADFMLAQNMARRYFPGASRTDWPQCY